MQALAPKIKFMFDKWFDGQINLTHCYRESNGAADALANLGTKANSDKQTSSQPDKFKLHFEMIII
jgi:hypothetical protein